MLSLLCNNHSVRLVPWSGLAWVLDMTDASGLTMVVMHYIVLIVLVLILVTLIWGAIKMRDRFEILAEFLGFLKERKLWWIMPMILVFAIVGLFVVITGNSAIGAFIYTLW